jgi:hypothetical protein
MQGYEHFGGVSRRDVLPRLLRLCLLLFLLACIFDPADKVLNVKVYIFALCWALTLAIYWSSGMRGGVPRGLAIYTLLFMLVPVYSVVWYFLTDGSEPFEGFRMLKGFILVTLASVLVLGQIDLLPRLCAVLTILAWAIIGVFVALLLMPQLITPLYLVGQQTDSLFIAKRAYTSSVVLTQVYFVTSPMLAISITYYFDKAWSARHGKALRLWALVAISSLAMMLAGTRNNILVAVLLPAALLLYYTKNKGVGTLLVLFAMGALVVLFATELQAFFDPTEESNSIKLALLDDFSRIFSDPVNLIFGRGLGSYETWTARGSRYEYASELTYLDMVRNFGLPGAVIVLGLLLFPVWHAFSANRSRLTKAIAIGFVFYLGMCASNPNLFSSMGILILSVMLSAIFSRAKSSITVGVPVLASPDASTSS